MKRKIIAISLLLSFLMVLLHEMVPHHHHEVTGNETMAIHNHSEKHTHHTKEDHHKHEKSHSHDDSETPEPESTQNFPIHFHTIASDSYDYSRVSSHNSASQNFSLLTVVLLCHLSSLNPYPPDQKQIKFRNHTIPLSSFLFTRAFGLRAPPVFA